MILDSDFRSRMVHSLFQMRKKAGRHHLTNYFSSVRNLWFGSHATTKSTHNGHQSISLDTWRQCVIFFVQIILPDNYIIMISWWVRNFVFKTKLCMFVRLGYLCRIRDGTTPTGETEGTDFMAFEHGLTKGLGEMFSLSRQHYISS